MTIQNQWDDLKEEYFFSKLNIDYPSDSERERTKEIIKLFSIKNGEELTKLYSKTKGNLSADLFEEFIKVSIEEFNISHLYCGSLLCNVV